MNLKMSLHDGNYPHEIQSSLPQVNNKNSSAWDVIIIYAALQEWRFIEMIIW